MFLYKEPDIAVHFSAMLTYQIRPRIFRFQDEQPISFPAQCVLRFHFQPRQAFGTEASGGRTAVKGKAASLFFNLNSGAHWIESKAPLAPLDVTIEEPSQKIILKGNVVEVSGVFDSLAIVENYLSGIYFTLPVLLNVDFADPPIVERVDGEVAGNHFRWELQEWKFPVSLTTQDKQEFRFADAWQRLNLVTGLAPRRLLAALHYFHVAVRLSRLGDRPGEFLSEATLNLSKTLEVLFPPDGDGKTRDSARRGLRRLGIEEASIETDYLPAMALRNEIDVGHVDLSLFTRDQLASIHAYTERAEQAFRQLLQVILAAVAKGEWTPPPYEQGELSAATKAVVARLTSMGTDAV